MLFYCSGCPLIYHAYASRGDPPCPECEKPMEAQNPQDAPWADIRIALTSNKSIRHLRSLSIRFGCPRIFDKQWLLSQQIPVHRYFGWDKLSVIMSFPLSLALASAFLYLPLIVYLLAEMLEPNSLLSVLVGKGAPAVQVSLVIHIFTAVSAALSMAFYFVFAPRHFKEFKTKRRFEERCKGTCYGHEMTAGQLGVLWDLSRYSSPFHRIVIASLIVSAFVSAALHFLWRLVSPFLSP